MKIKKKEEIEINFIEEWTKIEKELFKKTNKINENICKEFRMDGKINERDFILQWNDKKLTYLFDKINDLNTLFKNDMITAIKKGNTIIINIFGPMFSGKSYVGISIAKFIQKNVTKIYKNIYPTLHITYNGFEVKKLISKVNKYDIIIVDENPKTQGKDSNKKTWNINNILKAGRIAQIFFIFIEPLMQKLPVCYFYLETAGKCEKTLVTRLILYSSNKRPQGCVYIPVLSKNHPYMVEYEKSKIKNLDDLFDNEGEVKKIDKKKTFKDNALLPSILKYDKNQSFSSFCKENIKDERIGNVAKSLTRGDSQRTIDDNFPELAYSFIGETSRWLRNESPENIGLGYLFERWFALVILQIPEKNIEKILGGSKKSKPDIIWKKKIYSLKYRITGSEKSYRFSQKRDFKPELEEAKKNNCKYNLVFSNPKWGLEIQIIEIDPNKDDTVYVFKNEK